MRLTGRTLRQTCASLLTPFTGASVLYRHDDAVWEIVQTEANRYFAGQISAEECAKAIQSRASIYLSEQCG